MTSTQRNRFAPLTFLLIAMFVSAFFGPFGVGFAIAFASLFVGAIIAISAADIIEAIKSNRL